ncbi:NACHT, LRR and PYD domains-containing protein 3-like isoform X1 [Salminus brasiliensis]|uniref:NACHT, LRR and PYD domains-containing protein 3-like isoform X1 n=2 Tax=Salminus brasiliensis TaxID=930266 RepID=UPI003B832B0C
MSTEDDQKMDSQRSKLPEPSCVSMKSDQSKDPPQNFREEGSPGPDSSKSPGPSCVSMKSDQSKDPPQNFRKEESLTGKRPKPSCVSMKSDQSKDPPYNFSHKVLARVKSDTGQTMDSSVSSQELLKENKRQKPALKKSLSKDCSSQQSGHVGSESDAEVGKSQRNPKDFFEIFNDLENKMIAFIKHELEMYKKLLRKQNTTYYRNVKQMKWNLKQTVLNMTLTFLNLMNHKDVATALQNKLNGIIQRPLKEGLISKFVHVCEGTAKQGESTRLNEIYTDLYITEGGAGQVNKEHEVRRIEKNQMQQDVQIKCKNMFEPLPGQDRPIRSVLTQGVAGIGKSICVQKFILDWAAGEDRQDIQFIFPLPFRELNLKKGCHSLMDIICFFFPETKGLILTDQNSVMFVFDGLDKCKLPLMFQKNESLNDVCKPAPLDVVLTNLIKGNLLPSALIWITTRPAAASRIPAEHVHRMTELRGFNNQQKEEYFRKRISDENLATKIIEHIKESRSLFIMCHIPVFCWISATVLQRILEETESGETPKTLTEMYTCFLIFQAVQGNLKYSGKNVLDVPWDKEAILSLGKLSFQHLEESNLIFNAEDLEACGVDPSKISVYSGLCTQETVRFLGTVFSFVHLSIQEFLAAVFAYLSLRNDHKNVFDQQSTSVESKTTELTEFLKTAVDKALKSDHGHLDLFLRFLLGLSLESNEKLIRGLLTQSGSRSDHRKEIVEYIKLKFKDNLSPERSINLFYCLNELNDDSLVKDIQSHMSSGSLSEAKLSPAQWSALVFVLLTSKEKLEVFDLQKFIRSEECLNRLLPVVQEATTALLSECNLTERSCSGLRNVLSSVSSTLTELDLSKNPIQDFGVERLSEGLKSPTCKLETLRLSECNLTERSCSALLQVLSSESSNLTLLDLSNNPIQDLGVELLSEGLKSPAYKLETLSLSSCSITGKGYTYLASALESNSSSPLTELDLRGNDPGDRGVKKLTDLVKNPKWKLNKLGLLKSSAAKEFCHHLTKTLGINPLLQTELDLSGRIQGDSEMKKLSDLIKDSHCRTQILKLNNSNITEKDCCSLSEALCLNPTHLQQLDLSMNRLGNPGVQHVCALLTNQYCNLKRLGLSDCSVTEEGYAALASALKSNPSSHLVEMDLRGNDPGSKGVELITDLQKCPNSKLKKLRLLKSPAAEEICASLTEALGINPLLQTELDLSGRIQGDSEMKQLSDLIKDSHCRTQILKVNSSSIAVEGCAALSSALNSNPSHLVELHLSGNKLSNVGVEQFCAVLKNPQCELQKLDLSDCSVTGEGYAALASALKLNPSSHLIELDLRGNDPGDAGVKSLHRLLEHPQHKLKTLKLLKSDAAEEAYTYFKQKLGKDPLLQTELDLSQTEPKEIRVDQLSALLEDPHCRLQKLTMYKSSSITERDCADLISALTVNPSHLRELDLSENKLDQAGLQKLCDLLKNPHCRLEKLRLKKCSIEEDGCAALTSALSSNPSHLRELDLRWNKLGKSVVQLSELMEKSGCSLQLDQSLLNRLTYFTLLWGITNKTQHSANQEKPEEDDEDCRGTGRSGSV